VPTFIRLLCYFGKHMPRSRNYNISPSIWKCPHCGHENTAAEIIRLDSERIQCAKCKQGFGRKGKADEGGREGEKK
jgi:hypothetical protein